MLKTKEVGMREEKELVKLKRKLKRIKRFRKHSQNMFTDSPIVTMHPLIYSLFLLSVIGIGVCAILFNNMILFYIGIAEFSAWLGVTVEEMIAGKIDDKILDKIGELEESIEKLEPKKAVNATTEATSSVETENKTASVKNTTKTEEITEEIDNTTVDDTSVGV